jgi:hypothetical protein
MITLTVFIVFATAPGQLSFQKDEWLHIVGFGQEEWTARNHQNKTGRKLLSLCSYPSIDVRWVSSRTSEDCETVLVSRSRGLGRNERTSKL